MHLRRAACLLLFATCASAMAEPLIYAGRLQRLVLQPRGAEGCPEPCALSQPNADGTVRVCISNMGGCQASEFSVNRVFAGDVGPMRTITSRIGEWGRTFPLTNELLLIHEDAGRTRWTYAVEREGRLYVRPGSLHSDVRSEARPIYPNDTGLVPVEQVIEKLRSGG